MDGRIQASGFLCFPAAWADDVPSPKLPPTTKKRTLIGNPWQVPDGDSIRVGGLFSCPRDCGNAVLIYPQKPRVFHPVGNPAPFLARGRDAGTPHSLAPRRGAAATDGTASGPGRGRDPS